MSYDVVIDADDPHSRPKVWVNGERGKVLRRTGVRVKYHFPKQKILLKLDVSLFFCHAQKESAIWNELDEADRKYFLPILQWGELEGNESITYVITPFLPRVKQIVNDRENLIPSYKSFYKEVSYLAKKYHFTGDWEARQMVLYAGEPMILDYGL